MGSISPERGPPVTAVNYRLAIFDIKFAPEWQYNGSVVIEARVARPTTEVVLHAAALDISSAELWQGSEDTTQICKSIDVSGATDGAARLCFPRALQPGPVHIRIAYRASIGNSMVGFFRARYRPLMGSASAQLRDGESSVVLATHFEPCHARWAFPCFDEPHLKATFDVAIDVPQGLTALSNMPIRKTTKLSGPKQTGRVRVEFQTTPVMSTYLLAWVVGEFEYVEALTEAHHGGIRVPVRVYTPLGLSKYAALALHCACKVLDLFKQLFGIDYPIPKSDHVVVPEFVSGAMENWGLITYKPTKILFDPATSDSRVMSKAAYVVAHELAHQWFGNLVTMDRWSGLWLNEGFATWAGYMAVDRLFPEWNIWGQYVAEIMDDVMRLDSLPTTHAIETPVQDENEALQMFDQISYFKAASIIRMLASQVGQDAFLQGLSRYLRTHAHRNARSQDLWDALSEVTGRDIPGMMDSWIHTCGYPVVRVREHDCDRRGGDHVEQQSVLSPGTTSSIAGPWKITLAATRGDTNGHSSVHRCDKPAQSPATDVPLVLNTGHVGYFCVDYDQEALESIAMSLPSLSSADLAGVIVDLANLATNCLKPTSELLDFLWKVRDTRDGYAWLSTSRCLAFVRSVFSDDATVLRGLRAYTADLTRGVRHDVRCSTPDYTAYTETELNKAVVALAFACVDEADEPIIQDARRRFTKWAAGDTAVLPPSMRRIILSGCVGIGSRAEFEAVKAAFASDGSLDGEEVLLAAMGSVNDPGLADEALDFAFASSGAPVALQHLPLLGGALGQNDACRDAQWAYVKSRWPVVSRRLEANSICRDGWVEESLWHFSDLTLGEEICGFLARHCGPAVSKPLDNVRANIRRNAAYKEWAREDISQWLASRGFPSLHS